MAGATITGIGCVTPIGIGLEEFRAALRSGRSGVGPLTLCDPEPYRCRIAAEVRDFRPQDFMAVREARSLPRVVQFAVAASRLALTHAGIRGWSNPGRVGVLIGSSIG